MIASAVHWSTQTVEAFLGAVPWQGSSSRVSLTEPNLVAEALNWRSLSVRDFFSRIAWDGRRHAPQSNAQVAQSLSYLLPTQEFFSCFAWEGCPNIGAVPQFTASPSKVPEISLDDLSDLF